METIQIRWRRVFEGPVVVPRVLCMRKKLTEEVWDSTKKSALNDSANKSKYLVQRFAHLITLKLAAAIVLQLACPAGPAVLAQTSNYSEFDDFNIGNDADWTRYDPLVGWPG